MNSEERKAARRARREAKRTRRKAERNAGCDLEAVADLNALHKAARQAARGVSWKASVQRYHADVLRNIVKARRDLLEGRDVSRGFITFDLYERGKLRHISAVHFSERVIQKSLTQNALVPTITPSLVLDNSANLKGRGTDFAIARLKKQLARFHRKHGTDGYVLLVDFSDYFARIAHEPTKAIVSAALEDDRLVALEHRLIDAQGDIGLGLGSEPNQILAVAFPSSIDHFVQEMCGVEAYGRYMDDSYCIHSDKAYLQVVQLLIERKCEELGIVINRRKTRIVRLSRGFTFLKKKFSFAENGRIVVRPSRESVTRERRKLKKQRKMVEAGLMTPEQVERSYQSWRGGMKMLDAHRTVLSMDALYRKLFSTSENAPRGGVIEIALPRAA